jgi:hypothetical protein
MLVAAPQPGQEMTKSKKLVRATDPDAHEYIVTDGAGRKIPNCVEANTFIGTVTVLLVEAGGLFPINDENELVRITYRPKGGVFITHRQPAVQRP